MKSKIQNRILVYSLLACSINTIIIFKTRTFSFKQSAKRIPLPVDEALIRKNLNSLKKSWLSSPYRDQARNAYLANTDLSDPTLNLDGLDFTEANLSHSKLRNNNLDFAIFNKANLESADLSYTSLSNTQFKDAILKNTNFSNARNISLDSILEAQDITGATFTLGTHLKPQDSSQTSFTYEQIKKLQNRGALIKDLKDYQEMLKKQYLKN